MAGYATRIFASPDMCSVCSSRHFTYLAHANDARAMMQDATSIVPRGEVILRIAMWVRVLQEVLEPGMTASSGYA